ncbi:uncharacterized protein ALTATR162_LOCUS5974 [Alternaria atra]|uniref:Uncharacterized protein n=1 Tax=Alternaria atra TaxID=119953 RepID=A0A8J2I101_9PLEO|nr:uncharacterized protein ALTATR162_LOCUS5974 [Alternaria atra]CAG5161171.1 unnamed protein product [Alternaria atra]
MASMQGSTIDSFGFSDYIEEESQVVSESKERSSTVNVPANGSINQDPAGTQSHQTSGELDDNGRSPTAPREALDQRESRESEGMVSNDKTVFQTPDESSECIHEPVKRPPTQSPQGKVRGASLPIGINLENPIGSKKSQLTPATSTNPTSSYSLRDRTQSKLVYDVRYHPMDDAIRPARAAKRRSAHGETIVVGSDDPSDASAVIDTEASAGDSSDVQNEDKEEIPKQGRKVTGRKQTRSRPLPTEGTRRSTRKVSNQKTSYNINIHPQDKYLVISSDDEDMQPSINKRRNLTHKRPNESDESGSDNKVAKKSKTSCQKRSRRTDLGTSDSLDSSGAPVFPSVETGNDSKHTIATTAFSHPPFVNSPLDHGVRRREGIDVWHYPPGKRYLNHDRDYWPTLPGQSFEIFDEKLEDQLAREAMEASPLNYEHDNKENMNNADVELRSDDYDGIYVMPSAQYRQSSDERQLAQHRALVSDALYSDEAPQSYGLDETYGTHELQTNSLTEYMDILASGGHLPPGQPQVETQTGTQDSVLDTDLIDEITGVESQAP